MNGATPEGTGSSQWPVTDWSDLAHAAGAVGKDGDRLGRLILKYRTPLRKYLLISFPALQAEADEILQDFAQDKFLREGWLRRADRRRGRFRDLLKTSLRNFVNDRLRRSANAPASLDALQIEPAAEQLKDEAFDLSWFRQVLAETLKRMELDCQAKVKNQPNRQQIWEVFRFRLVQPILSDSEPLAYSELVAQCGIQSPTQAQNLLATGKRMFERLLGEVIGEYERGGGPRKEEVEHFRRFLEGLARANRQ